MMMMMMRMMRTMATMMTMIIRDGDGDDYDHDDDAQRSCRNDCMQTTYLITTTRKQKMMEMMATNDGGVNVNDDD